jgi:hypothetical protein
VSTPLETAEQFRERLLRNERASALRLVRAYGGVYRQLLPQIEALIAELESTPDVKAWKKARLRRLKDLKRQIEWEVNRFAAFLEGDLRDSVLNSIELGNQYSQAIARAIVPGVRIRWNKLPVEAIETLLGFFAEGSTLRESLNTLGPGVAQVVEDKLLKSLTIGMHPRRIAAELRGAVGQGLTWALRTSRTTQLYAYREATRANYVANGDVVQGWRWLAAKDRRTCLACLAMDGREFPLSQPLEDHWNGRCTMVPVLIGMERVQFETGREWFEKQPEVVQRAMMGKARWKAWRDGKFEFDQLAVRKLDKAWGHMQSEATLKELLGEMKNAA